MNSLLMPNRCDQCAKRGLGCSRDIPICKSCEHLDIECNYERALKTHKKIKPEVERYINSFKIQNKEEFVILDYKEDAKENGNQQNKLNQLITKPTSFKHTFFKVVSDETQVIKEFLNIVNSFPRKRIINNFLALFEFPTLKDNGDNDIIFMEVIKKFDNITKIKNKVPLLIKEPNFNTSTIKGIYSDCIDAFFKFVNPFIPLFTKKSFFSRPRTELVLCSVYLSGISHLESNTFNNTLKLYLEYKVHSLFKKQYSLNQFDTLQAFLIIALGLQSYGWVRSCLWYLHTVAIDMSYSLGLHRGSPTHLDSNLILERKLAYTSITHLSYILNWSCDVPCLVSLNGAKPYKTASTKAVYKQYLKTMKMNLNLWTVSDYCCLITAESTSQQGETFNLINLWRIQAMHQQLMPSVIYKHIDEVTEILRKKGTYYSNKLLCLKASTPKELHHILERHAHFILFRSIYGIYWVYSLVLYFRTNTEPEKNKLHSKYMKLAIEEAAKVITYDIVIGTDTHYNMRLGLVSRCLLFLIRHIPKYDQPEHISKTIILGINHFITLKQSSWITGQVTFSLALFYLVSKNMCKNPTFSKVIKDKALNHEYEKFYTLIKNEKDVLNCFSKSKNKVRFDLFH
ncbi:hypothetical protein K502DRAFT_120558 [Neoconidiobolus thromboides FSU 785]|nr:hypothetical protein K502DRAFT_120558 [Neoconidiobolus thromboides FSU 785]